MKKGTMMISPIKFVSNVTNNAKTNKVVGQINDYARGYTQGLHADKLELKETAIRDALTHKIANHGKLNAFWQGIKDAVSKK